MLETCLRPAVASEIQLQARSLYILHIEWEKKRKSLGHTDVLPAEAEGQPGVPGEHLHRCRGR